MVDVEEQVMPLIDKARMVREFIELVQIDSLSKRERKMADTLKGKLEDLGLQVYEDDAGSKIGGNAGNLICTLKGNADIPAVLLTAHMDTVSPGLGKKPRVEGDTIKSDGTTVLGGDDAAGIECVLEVLRVLAEGSLKHGDVQVAFTVAEEEGLYGSKNLDYGKIHARYCFSLDNSGKIGSVNIKAPAEYKIVAVINGKSAHAGLEPEKGISAVQIAADAISRMKLGRLDEETTANIGVIEGGSETNIVCDRVEVKAEARSRNEQKLEAQVNHMKECFEQAAAGFGGSAEVYCECLYPSFTIEEDDPILSVLRTASQNTGIELILKATGGGSDTNQINARGIRAVDLSVGTDKAHTLEEQLNLQDLVRAAEFLLAAVTSMDTVKTV
jgi:tripeptide aminopeptidase